MTIRIKVNHQFFPFGTSLSRVPIHLFVYHHHDPCIRSKSENHHPPINDNKRLSIHLLPLKLPLRRKPVKFGLCLLHRCKSGCPKFRGGQCQVPSPSNQAELPPPQHHQGAGSIGRWINIHELLARDHQQQILRGIGVEAGGVATATEVGMNLKEPRCQGENLKL